MYTQCPDCSAAFRVTANDLKQAAGKVRCGGCGSAFDALQFLSEEMPEQPPPKESVRQLPELKPARRGSELPEKISPEESIALLKTLDELAGSDIRVEDTGIEWRVLDDQVIAELETADGVDEQIDPEEEPDNQIQFDADEEDEQPPVDEPRYDDDTPIPEDFGDDEAAAAPAEGMPDEESESQPDEFDMAFDDDETGDWEEILDEFDEPDTTAQADDNSDGELPVPIGVHAAGSDDEDPGDEIDGEANDVDEDEAQVDETVDVDEDERRDDQTDDVGADQDGDGEAGDDLVDDEHLPDVQEEPVEVESIIMEGETVRNALDEFAEGERPADADIAYWVPPENDVAPTRSTAAKFGTSFGVVLLLLLLALQVVHYYRDTLATIPDIQKIIAPVYRTIGMPLSPDWDVNAWRFEATQGNTDSDDELIVYSRIGNTGTTSLPYPLIGISLTDRFDETVGSRLLEPQEFLPEGANPRKKVPAGATFDAVISIKSPDTSATGYKLNVCYRSNGATPGGSLRCAIGDFMQ